MKTKLDYKGVGEKLLNMGGKDGYIFPATIEAISYYTTLDNIAWVTGEREGDIGRRIPYRETTESCADFLARLQREEDALGVKEKYAAQAASHPIPADR